MKLVGCEQKSGAFVKDGKQIVYDNLMLYCTNDCLEVKKDESGKVVHWGVGSKVETFKIKNTAENLKLVFGKYITEKDLAGYIGYDINVYFDGYSNVACVQFIKP